ncbi:hypothetical protein [Burkholderia sp. BCC0398]|uniref:hypothetical protein n=1 Tax=Burkholderia sp. BCC0398 TaxID=2676297 RepID=UPI001588FCA2|nr:hypothetical protein [Burkholderia sp. BCC0398]
MKKFGAFCALLLISALAYATTFVSPGLINPAGSTTGQAIVSTGSSTSPVWGSIGVNGIAAIAANTVIANATGSSASPTAYAMPSCSSAGNALNWQSGTGFHCSTGLALTSGGLNQFATTTSAQLASIVSDETGSGSLVFGTNPTIAGATFTGGVSLGYAAPVFVLNDTGASVGASIEYRSNGTKLWETKSYGTVLSWNLGRYVSGSYVDNPISVSNSTGVVTIADGLTANGAMTLSYAGPIFTLNDTSGTGFPGTIYKNNGVQNWALHATSSSNSFALDRYVGGSFADSPISVSNSTGAVTMPDGITNSPISGSTGAFTTLSASGNDALVYQNSSGQSIPNATTTTVTNWTKLFDRVNSSFNATTGVFTAPATGYYRVSASAQFAATAGAVGNQLGWVVTANAVVVAQSPYFVEAANSTARTVSVNTIVSLTAGQTMTLGLYQNTGAALALSSTAANNWVSISRVP